MRTNIGLFVLGILVTVAFYEWRIVPRQVRYVDTLAVVQEDDWGITVAFPNRNGMVYRARIPKATYPSYEATIAVWNEHSKEPGWVDPWVESRSDY